MPTSGYDSNDIRKQETESSCSPVSGVEVMSEELADKMTVQPSSRLRDYELKLDLN